MKAMIHEARLAFPNIFTARPGEKPGDKPKFGLLGIVDPTTKVTLDGGKVITIAQLGPIFDAVGAEKWGEKSKPIMDMIRKTNKLCLKSGDEKANYDGFAGHLFFSANGEGRPTVYDRNKAPLVESSGKPYAGCYCNVAVEFWAQDNGFGKRINAQLRGVQFVRDGDAFAAGSPAEEGDFPDLADQGEDTDPTA